MVKAESGQLPQGWQAPGEFKLFYRGRINDNWQNQKAASEHNLGDAIKSLIKGEDPPQNQPASIGCSIKWSEE